MNELLHHAEGKTLEFTRDLSSPIPDLRPESRPESILAIKIFQRLLVGHASKAQLAQHLRHKTVSGELKKQITHMLTLEFIEMTRPDIPNSRLQQYKLTDLGRQNITKP